MVEKSILDNLFTTCYSGRNVYLKIGDVNVLVSFVKYENGRVMLRVEQDIPPGRNLLYVRYGEEVVFSHLRFVARKDLLSVFDVENLQVMKAPRQEERRKVDQGAAVERPYITGVLSDFIISESLAREIKLTARIKDELTGKIAGSFPRVRIFFIHERKQDQRMKFFLSRHAPLLIPDINDPALAPDGDIFNMYMDRIYPEDAELKAGAIISEMTVPLLYRGMMPFGYIQVNGEQPFSNSDMSALRKAGISNSELLSRERKLIVPSEDRFHISDLSLHGLSIIFREKSHIRFFKEGSLLMFSLVMPGKGQATILATVKNITQGENMVYRVGCSIENIDSIGEAHYEEYLEAMGSS